MKNTPTPRTRAKSTSDTRARSSKYYHLKTIQLADQTHRAGSGLKSNNHSIFIILYRTVAKFPSIMVDGFPAQRTAAEQQRARSKSLIVHKTCCMLACGSITCRSHSTRWIVFHYNMDREWCGVALSCCISTSTSKQTGRSSTQQASPKAYTYVLDTNLGRGARSFLLTTPAVVDGNPARHTLYTHPVGCAVFYIVGITLYNNGWHITTVVVDITY